MEDVTELCRTPGGVVMSSLCDTPPRHAAQLADGSGSEGGAETSGGAIHHATHAGSLQSLGLQVNRRRRMENCYSR